MAKQVIKRAMLRIVS